MALPATHNKEPGGLIRAGTEQSDCVLEIRGRDERSSTTGPQRETTLERHQGPFVKSLQSQQSCWGILYTHTHTHWETLTFPTRAHTESHKRTFPNIYAQTISRQTTASNRPLPLSLPDSDSQAVINISVGVTGQSVSGGTSQEEIYTPSPCSQSRNSQSVTLSIERRRCFCQ